MSAFDPLPAPTRVRGANGRFGDGVKRTPLQRFLMNCQFDPGTGCVLWTGGTTSGRGHSSPYGSFWFEGRRWFAHRWAAKFIHGQTIDGHQVDHCCNDHCPDMDAPNTLCVQHVQAVTPAVNRELQWIRAQVGLDPTPPVYLGEPNALVPFYEAPSWLSRCHQSPVNTVGSITSIAPF